MSAPIPGVVAGRNWQPGDPLYNRGAHRQHFFNFRDTEEPPEECRPCVDAASWPVPRINDELHHEDEITLFLRRVAR